MADGDDRGGVEQPEPEVVFIDAGDGTEGPPGPDPPRGPRRPAGRGRRIGLVLAVAVAFLIGVVVGRSGLANPGPGGAAAATATAPASTARPATSPATEASRTSATRASAASTVPTVSGPDSVGIPAGVVWASLRVGDGPIQAVAWVGGRRPGLVVLERGYLAKVSGGRVPYIEARRRVDPRLGDPATGSWHLLFDGTRVWAVSSGTGASNDAVRVRGIDPVTLKPGPVGPASASPGGLPVTDAAALDGHVYLKAPFGIFVVVAHRDSAPSVDFAGLAGGPSIVADPRRHRLLTVSHGSGEQYTVAAVTPRRPSTTSRTAADAPPPGSTLENSLYQAIIGVAVVGDGPIWASIGPVHGPATAPTLIRLDPTTLNLWPPSRSVARADHTFTLVGGASRLWLRGTGNDHQLWCLDADSGEPLQYWPRLDGTITPAPDGGMYLAYGNSLGRLKLNKACTPPQS